MVNKKFWLAMSVIALVFGMTVVGCDDGSTDGDDEDGIRPLLCGGVIFDNYYPVVGETITASFQRASDINGAIIDPIGTPSWTWYKTKQVFLSQATDKTSIGYDNTYTVRQSDEGYYLYAELSYSGNSSTADTRTHSTVIGIPATATVSVSISAVYHPSRSYNNHDVTVTLSLSDGRWNKVSYSTASQWLTMSGTPSVSSWVTNSYSYVIPDAQGRELVFYYTTKSDTTLPISGLTATLNTAQLSTMRSNTNVYNTLTAGTPSSASVSQWTISEY